MALPFIAARRTVRNIAKTALVRDQGSDDFANAVRQFGISAQHTVVPVPIVHAKKRLEDSERVKIQLVVVSFGFVFCRGNIRDVFVQSLATTPFDISDPNSFLPSVSNVDTSSTGSSVICEELNIGSVRYCVHRLIAKAPVRRCIVLVMLQSCLSRGALSPNQFD